jgi:hypothetical protein
VELALARLKPGGNLYYAPSSWILRSHFRHEERPRTAPADLANPDALKLLDFRGGRNEAMRGRALPRCS